MIPEAFAVAFSLQAKIILSPLSIAMLVALGLCVAIVWRFCKRKI
jgi:hypothetical protein